MIVRTASGAVFDTDSPSPDAVHIEDIGQSLAAQPCYGGRSAIHYTRADRARAVAASLPVGYRVRALLMDAHWAYMPDAGFAPGFDPARIRACIFAAFNVSVSETADKIVNAAYRAAREGAEGHVLFPTSSPKPISTSAWASEHRSQSKLRFLRVFYESLAWSAGSTSPLNAGERTDASILLADTKMG